MNDAFQIALMVAALVAALSLGGGVMLRVMQKPQRA